MITKLNKAHQECSIQELCKLFKLPRSSYYYQAKVNDKSMGDTIKSIIQSMKQISIETGHTYGKRRLKHHLNAKGH